MLFCLYIKCKPTQYEPPHDKTNKMSAPSEDSDQPGHPPSLTRVFAVHMKKAWVLSYPLSAQQRLWSDLSHRWVHVSLLVLSRGGSFALYHCLWCMMINKMSGCCWADVNITVTFRTDRSGQMVQTQIRLLLIRIYTLCHSICIFFDSFH